MTFGWLKSIMPRGLYGRAAMILVLPVLVLQLVVSVAFIQRYFEDVTIQMTGTVIRELHLVEDLTARADSQAAAMQALAPVLEPLRFEVAFLPDADVPLADSFRWYDFSGRVIIRSLRRAVPGLLAVQLPDDLVALIYLDSGQGGLQLQLDRRRLSAAAPHQLPVILLFSGALMTIIAYLYLRNQLRPITKLASAAEAFGRGQTVPYGPGGATEVRAAGSAFLAMRARIERQIEQRTMMLSGVSHDLRTPLTRLRLGLALMPEDETAPLLRDVDEMQRMLDEFLSFAKGTTEGETEKVDPRALVNEVIEDARRAGKPVRLRDVDGSGQVKLRPLAIRRALENLIQNAVRYGSQAEVSVAIMEKSLRIRVEDDGPGIPEDQRSEAVKPFSRLDPARNQDLGGGVGLGLAITADIARAHGGLLRLGQSPGLGGLQADIVIGR